MALTPLLLMAAEGLLLDDALEVVPLDTSTYLSKTIVLDYAATVSAFIAAESGGKINQTLVDDLISRLDSTAPYISNKTSTSGVESITYTTFLDQHVTNIFPNDQQFVQYALIAMGLKDTANKYVNSAVNGAALTAQTFTSQDALMSGNIAAVSTNPQAWGQELINTGVLFDFVKLDSIGTPQAIIEAMMRANVLGFISDELEFQGVSVATLAKSINENPDLVLNPLVQKRCYDAFLAVTGEKLTKILEVMQFTTAGIGSLADLLDLTKIFPGTYTSLNGLDDGTLRLIYSGSSLAPFVQALTAPVSSVIPSVIAKANSAFSCSLNQVTGIRRSTPANIGQLASGIEINTGLSAIANLTEALPASTTNSIISSMGGGSGPDTTFYLTDFIGAAAAEPQNGNFITINANIDTVQTAGGFADIAEVLLIMREVLGGIDTIRVTFDDNAGAGPYEITILPGFPGEGTYTDAVDYDYTAALNALLIELDTEVANYSAAYPTEHADNMLSWSHSADSIVAAIKQFWDANVRWETTYVTNYQTNDPALNGLAAQKSSTLAFSENLHTYGRQTSKNDIAVILEAMAKSNQAGDAIIAAMREGRNLPKISSAGITGDNQISDKPSVVEPGDIS